MGDGERIQSRTLTEATLLDENRRLRDTIETLESEIDELVSEMERRYYREKDPDSF